MTGRLLAATTLVIAALAANGAAAAADSGRLADFSAAFTSSAPGSPSGLAVHLLFHAAGDPNAKPPALRSAVIHGPEGLRFDSGAVDACTASDDEIRVLGSNACPADSQLTVGSFSAVTGFGPPVDPLAGDDHVFNGPNQIIEIITAPGTPLSPAFDRLTISGSTLTAHPPAAPGGPPDGQTAVRSIDFRIPVRSSGGRSLITTPPYCPAGGEWTTTGTFGFADGSSDTVASQTPCDSAGAAVPAAPRPARRRYHARIRSCARRRAHLSRPACRRCGARRGGRSASGSQACGRRSRGAPRPSSS